MSNGGRGGVRSVKEEINLEQGQRSSLLKRRNYMLIILLPRALAVKNVKFLLKKMPPIWIVENMSQTFLLSYFSSKSNKEYPFNSSQKFKCALSYQTRWRTYMKEVWKSREFFWFIPQIPAVSSKPGRIFRSLSVFTKTSWQPYVNFKYWFPISSFIELSHEAALHMFEMLILHDCACVLSALCAIFFYL